MPYEGVVRPSRTSVTA